MKKPVKNTKPATSQAASLRKLAEKRPAKKWHCRQNKRARCPPKRAADASRTAGASDRTGDAK